MYYIFSIHSSVNRHSGCFCVLAIVNSTVMNIGVHVSFRIMAFSGYICPGVGLLGHMVVLFVVFLRNLHTLLHSGVPIYIPTNNIRFPFLHTLSSIYCLQTFCWWPFWQVWDDNLIVVLICISLRVSDVEHLFMCFLPMCLLWRKV